MATVRTLPKARSAKVLTWVPVTDAAGRTHMEMHWHIGAPAARGRRVSAA